MRYDDDGYEDEGYRTPLYGYPDDPNDTCEECGAPGGVACRSDCWTGGEPEGYPYEYQDMSLQ